MGSHRHRTGFDDNEWTVRGHLTHRVVDQPGGVSRSGVRTERALPLWSDELGLNGKADVVEFRGRDAYPVEYKAGKRVERPAVLQLAAQAVCLEEMFGIAVPVGALYLAALRERVGSSASSIPAASCSFVNACRSKFPCQFATTSLERLTNSDSHIAKQSWVIPSMTSAASFVRCRIDASPNW